MSLLTILRLCRNGKNIIPAQYTIQANNYAHDKKTKGAKQKIDIPVEKDVNKLLTYACGTNIYNEGEDAKLKPDSEYPDWLWTIRTEPPKLSDFDPDTKEYWKFVRRLALRRNNKLIKFKAFR